ncbi:MAG: hypothetical protein JWM11_1805 [Planctomycetaceae bacterium]|nr:hypothetical protein [Planctomycetaceae bacterium]
MNQNDCSSELRDLRESRERETRVRITGEPAPLEAFVRQTESH